MKSKIVSVSAIVLLVWSTAVYAQSEIDKSSRIEGRILTPSDAPAAGVKILLQETREQRFTDVEGVFSFRVSPGVYTLVIETHAGSETLSGLNIEFLETLRIEHVLGHETQTYSLFSASLSDESLEQSPVSAAVLDRQLDLAFHQQIPVVLDQNADMHMPQSSVQDFHPALRGPNGYLNLRTAVFLEDRNPIEPFYGLRDLSFSPGEARQLEVVHGPTSAVYGQGAASGVIRLVAKRPRMLQGGSVRLKAGDPGYFGGEFQWSKKLGEQWNLQLSGSATSQEQLSLPRVDETEYSTPCEDFGDSGCLPQERGFLNLDDYERNFGSVRLDRKTTKGGSSAAFLFETGFSTAENSVALTDLGRVQIDETENPWGRVEWRTDRWSLAAAYQNRMDDQILLTTDDRHALDISSWTLKAHTRQEALDGDLRWSAGFVHQDERVDTDDPNGPERRTLQNPRNQQTLLFEVRDGDHDGFFGQADWMYSDKLRFSAGARSDSSSNYETQFSPRASLAFSTDTNQTVRLTYQEGFRAPSYSELFLLAEIADPVNLSFLEFTCDADGVVCGFDLDHSPVEVPGEDTTADTRALALGNRNLDVERNRSLELAYDARFGSALSLSLRIHHNEYEDLISDLLPQFSQAGAPLNPDYLPYTLPQGIAPNRQAALLADLQDLLMDDFGRLTILGDETPILAFFSYTNLADVESDGADIHLRWNPNRTLTVDFSYSWMEFDLGSGSRTLRSGNIPENRARLGIDYRGEKWHAVARVHWDDEYFWASGPFAGVIDSRTTVDLGLSLRINDAVSTGFYVIDALDEEDYETFGGDLLPRRIYGALQFRW